MTTRYLNTVPRTSFNFKQYIMHQEAIKLYRNVLQAVRQVPFEDERLKLFESVRKRFRDNVNISDDHVIETLLKEGRQELEYERIKYEIEPTEEEKYLKEKKARDRVHRCIAAKNELERTY